MACGWRELGRRRGVDYLKTLRQIRPENAAQEEPRAVETGVRADKRLERGIVDRCPYFAGCPYLSGEQSAGL